VLFARSGNPRTLLAACALCGLGIATHPSAIWIVPAVVVASFWQRRAVTRGSLGFALIAFTIPFVLYAYLPVRSAIVAARGLDPAAATPIFTRGSIDWDTNAPRTPAGFLDEVLARKQGAGHALLRTADLRALPEAALLWFNMASAQYPIWLLLLAAAGTLTLARHDLRPLSILAVGALGGVLFLRVYRMDAHLDRYVFVSFAVVAVLAAASVRLPRMRLIAILALAVLAGLELAQDRPRLPLGPRADGDSLIAAVRGATPDRAIVIASWDDATVLGYGAFVERALGSRIIITAWFGMPAGAYERWEAARPLLLRLSPVEAHQVWYMPPGAPAP